MLFPSGNTNHLSLAKSDLFAFHDFGGLPAQSDENRFSILVEMISDFATRREHSKKPAQVFEQVFAGQDFNPVRFTGIRILHGQKVRGFEMFHGGSLMEFFVLTQEGYRSRGFVPRSLKCAKDAQLTCLCPVWESVKEKGEEGIR